MTAAHTKKITMTTRKEDGDFVGHRTGLKEESIAPDFKAKDQHGNTLQLSDFSGKILILYFYPKDDTPACTSTACNLRDEYMYLLKKNYAVVGVSADNEKSHARFAKKYDLPFPILADTDMSIIKAYDVWGKKMLFGRIYDGIVRTTFIIDALGIIKNIITKVDTEDHTQQILSLES